MARQKIERTIQNGIIQAAGLFGWRLWHFDAGAARRASRGAAKSAGGTPPVGWPDLTGLTHWGRFVAFEVKKPGERLEPEQAAWLCDLRKMGAITAWFTDIEVAAQFMQTMNNVYNDSKKGVFS